MEAESLVILIIIIVIVVWIIRESPITINIVRGSHYRGRIRTHDDITIRKRRKSRGSPIRNLPVKTVCGELDISYNFSCVGERIKINTETEGGILPYMYRWNVDGQSSESSIPHRTVDSGSDVVLTVIDARGCETRIDIVMPDSDICSL